MTEDNEPDETVEPLDLNGDPVEEPPEGPDVETSSEEPDDPDGDPRGYAGRAGTMLGGAASALITAPYRLAVGTTKGLTDGVTRVVPFGWRIGRALSTYGFRQMRKSTGADAIATVARGGGKVDPVPVKYRAAHQTEENKSKWISVDGSEEWNPGSEGSETDYFGKTPIIWVTEDAHEVGSKVQARVAEAWDLGHKDALYREPTIKEITVLDGADANGEAVADGGQVVNQRERYLDADGEFEDYLVDLSSGSGFDGMRVSWRKYIELYPDVPTTEEYQQQETRGRIAEMDPERNKRLLIKVLGLVAIILGIVVLGPPLMNYLFGTGAADSVSVSPLGQMLPMGLGG